MTAVVLRSGNHTVTWDGGIFTGDQALVSYLTSVELGLPNKEIALSVVGPRAYPGFTNPISVLAAALHLGLEVISGPDLMPPEGAVDGSNADDEISKHGDSHDESSHGNWANGDNAVGKPLSEMSREEFDSKQWVYHGTSNTTDLDTLLTQGVLISNTPQNLARQRYASGEYAEYAPGRGIGQGLYITGTVFEAIDYGHHVIAIDVTGLDDNLAVPPENDYHKTVAEALEDHNGALIAKDIPLDRVHLVARNITHYHYGDGWEAARDPRWAVSKHMGPGDHPSGSGQDAHGRQGLLHVQRGKGTLKNAPISKYLVLADGSEAPLSFDLIDDITGMKVGDQILPIGSIKGQTRPDLAIKQINAILKDYDLDPADIPDNYDVLFNSALDRYEDNPDIIDLDRFYERWHGGYSKLSTETGYDVESLAAAGAVISPGLDSQANLVYVHDIARMMSSNDGQGPIYEGEALTGLRAALQAQHDALLSPVYLKNHQEVLDGVKLAGDPRTPPAPGGYMWRKADGISQALNSFGDRVVFANITDHEVAARTLQFERAFRGQPPGEIYAEVGSDQELNLRSDVGFSVKNYSFMGNAVGVLRGDLTPDQALGDIKTRSFYNNVIDYTNASGGDYTTVDFHTMDFSFFVRGSADETRFQSGAKIQGVGVGIRPVVADAIRNFVPTAQASLGDAIGETISPQRVQEILWAEWERGLVAEGGGKLLTHWQSFDGELYELGRL